MNSKTQIALPDNKKNASGEDHEFDYWSEEFGISKDELVAAVKAGGTYAGAVEKYVKQVAFAR